MPVIVYVVVLLGDTERVPHGGTPPIPGLIDMLEAFDDDQLSVELLPRLIVLGDAEILTVGGAREPSRLPRP